MVHRYREKMGGVHFITQLCSGLRPLPDAAARPCLAGRYAYEAANENLSKNHVKKRMAIK